MKKIYEAPIVLPVLLNARDVIAWSGEGNETPDESSPFSTL